MRSYNDRGDPLSITIQYEQGGAIEQIWPKRNKPWVDLTDKEREEIAVIAGYDPLRMTVYEYRVAIQIATEAKLKEKNGG